VRRCGLEAITCDDSLAPLLSDLNLPLVSVPRHIEINGIAVEGIDGAVVQLSSGTTGHKKGIRLSLADVESHALAYNSVMAMNPRDCVVSWLPLYHDMGFIACFAMPLLLGIPLVLIDPMVWVKDPGILFQAIEQFGGTICYMPNFGFEVMSRVPSTAARDLVRHWISCSEPTYAQTIRRFCETTGVRPNTVSTCYGMAENVFAVTQSDGFVVRDIAGTEVVSCGRPIPGTDVATKESELWVRSATSVRSYVGSDDVTDSEGYYPTGDIGKLLDGEVFVLGRKRDIMICSGQKYFLNDLDHKLNEVVADCNGRGATVADVDSLLPGTQVPLCLVERPGFWRREELLALQEELRGAAGLEALQLRFVPQYFITKTSSGKINRTKTLEDWKLCRRSTGRSCCGPVDVAGRLQELFPGIRSDKPLDEGLDSLGLVVLQLTLENLGISWRQGASLDELLSSRASSSLVVEAATGTLSVVSISDANWLGFVDADLLQELSDAAGVPVHFEHVCAPPSFALLRDLIFHDYFMPRDLIRDYGAFAGAIRKIRNASLLIIDDLSEFWFPDNNDAVYPVLSHRFRHDAQADFVGVRWAAYTSNHHRFARELVWGAEIPAELRRGHINDLLEYLSVPAFRIALAGHYAAYTRDWEYRDYRAEKDLGDFEWRPSPGSALIDFVKSHKSTLRRIPGAPENRRRVVDQPHFCSWLINKAAIDYVVQRYERFCICGLPSSMPYLERELIRLGKRYFYSSTLQLLRDDFDCVLQTGSWGMPTTTKPIFDLMGAAVDRDRPTNVPPEVAAECPRFRAGRIPKSAA
jgi:hypothetical protein